MTTSETKSGVVELARDVYVWLSEGRTNSGFIVGDDSVLVIDSNRAPSVAREIIADVKRVTDKPIRYVIDTHYHWDHLFGNQEFPGSVIIGQANVRIELEQYGESMRERIIRDQPDYAEEMKTVQIRPPEVTFEDKLSLHFAGRRIDLLYFGYAHTKGDIFIYLPDDRVVYTGDCIAARRAPAMMDGHIRSWVTVDDRVLELDVERFGPGHGVVGTKQDMVEARTFMADFWQGCVSAFREGKSEDEAFASLKLEGKYAGWESLDRTRIGVRRAYMELKGELR